MDIQTKNVETASLIQQGFGHLLGMWDFQAYRFFLEALKQEPQSLMATTGVALCLAGAEVHLSPQREVATKQLDTLLKAPQGTTFEKKFAEATLKLTQGDISGWTDDLKDLAEEKGKGWQIPALFYNLFARDGFTVLGEPRYLQKKSITALKELCNKEPKSPACLSLFVAAQIENPNTRDVYEKRLVLPTARKLVRLHPNYPYYQLLLGHCELKCGEPFLSAKAYKKAISLYTRFLTQDKISIRNCRQLIDAKLGLISAYIIGNNLADARMAVNDLLETRMPSTHKSSQVAAAIRWEGQSLPIRMACFQNDTLAMTVEANRIEQSMEGVSLKERSLSDHFLVALETYARTRIALEEKNQREAGKQLERFIFAGAQILNSGSQAVASNEAVYWERGNLLISILEDELKARFEMSDAKVEKVNVISKITAAIDKQSILGNLMPPIWLTPMELIKADFLASIGLYEEALVAYDQAYCRQPNHIRTTEGLASTLEALGRNTEAQETREKLQKLKR